MNGFKTFYAFSLAWQLGFMIAISIGGFLALGIWGDKFFGTHPLLLLVGIIAGVIGTVYEMYHMFVVLVKDEKEPKNKNA